MEENNCNIEKVKVADKFITRSFNFAEKHSLIAFIFALAFLVLSVGYAIGQYKGV